MISLYFGKPGCGKTTLLVKSALKGLKAIEKDKKRILKGKKPLVKYNYVCSNIEIKGCVKIKFDDLRYYEFNNCLILIDEVTLDADSRDFKSFNKQFKEFFILHRHYKNDIMLFTQFYNRVDKTIRDILDKIYYIKKIGILSRVLEIPTQVIVPEETGEIIQGYRLPKGLERMTLTKWLIRPIYYKYFNTYSKLMGNNRTEFNYKNYII